MDPKRLDYVAHLEYLGLTEAEAAGALSPFEKRTEEEKADPAKFVLRLMRNPDYFYYTCKVLLNVELMPFQCAILKELWTCRFPMLIGSRGLGKSFLLGVYAVLRALLKQGSKVVICGSGFRQAKTVFNYSTKIWHESPTLQSLVAEHPQSGIKLGTDRWVLQLGDSTVVALPVGDGCLSADTVITYEDRFGTIADLSTDSRVTDITDRGVSVYGNGSFRPTDEAYNNGVRPTKIVRTAMGFEYEATHNHMMKVARDGRVVWVRADCVQHGDRILIDRSYRWHSGTFAAEPVEAYAVGVMIGDGTYCDEYNLSFATIEPDHFIPLLNRGIGFEFKPRADAQHWGCHGKKRIAAWMGRWGLERVRSLEKVLPPGILQSSREATAACISGLFDTDGHYFRSEVKGGVSVSVTLTNTSLKLMKQVQYVLLHYGIVAHLSGRDRNEKWNTAYSLMITGEDVVKFAEEIGFWLPRKQNGLLEALADKTRFVSTGDTVPFVRDAILSFVQENRIRRGSGTRATLRILPSRVEKRMTVTHSLAATFLDVHGHREDDRVGHVRGLANPDIYYDEVVSIADGECETFDIHVPDGHEYCANGFFSHNTKIRGERANCIVADEMASIPEQIFEEVISGFGVVNLSPVQQVKKAARRRAMLNNNLITAEQAGELRAGDEGNQILMSGTAYYAFNHFFKYWKKWKTFVESRGDRDWLLKNHGMEVGDTFNHRDYKVVRFPYTLLPENYYDEAQIERSKHTLHSGNFACEFAAVFSADSNGFYKRSLIETCVTSKARPVTPGVSGASPVWFDAVTRGNPSCRYIMGIDPASEKDNFAIIILEIHPDHRRVVYCWTTNRERFKAKVNQHVIEEKDYYGYCARKVRNLLRDFPGVEAIALDAQGGGQSGVLESLHDPDKMQPGEKAIWIVQPGHPLSDGKERPEDDQPGLHIVELVQFADAKYVAAANHGLRKDFEDRVLLFPQRDAVTLSEAFVKDQEAKRIFDTLEDCVDEIDELKDELATIEHSQTPGTLRDKWDTPEVKQAGSKKGRMRKDRYSALLMANYAARRLDRQFEMPAYEAHGGFADRIQAAGSEMYSFAPDWFNEQTQGNYDHYGWA